ncbi:hypothetical protein [Bradyrhizobium sp. WSM1253]|uniref:hypothetical protein n=1 Tax=Bradyrhizobium sp. WSM1253 TaxID=319003 RepID=UPI00025D3047|nr:hypothetical protein [Bradyrhizobium sp. WSM1253]EIG62811.1 hypothetical protein Bra1253DRAFT_07747 [Bradyrhizobium sp. WSM1253]
MKAVLIDPTTKAISVIDLRSVNWATNMFFGERPTPALKLPRSEILLAAKSRGGDAFVLGGSRPIGGPGLIVGRKLEAGERAPALVDPDQVAQMVRWTSIEEPDTAETRTTVRAIEIDPERRSIEEFSIAPTMHAVLSRMGGEIRLQFRAPGGDAVFAAADAARNFPEWRKDDATFTGRCIIVGHGSRSGRLVDVAASLTNLRESVTFRSSADNSWTSYECASENSTAGRSD